MKTIMFVADAAPDFETPALLALAVARYTPQGQGIMLDEQRKRIRILDALDAAKGTDSVVLEDADYDVLRICFIGFPFGLAHRDIVRAGDAIEAAKS